MMIVSYISLVIAIAALLLSLFTWTKTHRKYQYDVADAILADLVKITLQYPEFRDDKYCRDALHHQDDQIRLRYDAYATLVWNYLETLYDTYGKRLRNSPFYGAMRYLGERHKHWLYDEDKHVDYNKNLMDFLRVEK